MNLSILKSDKKNLNTFIAAGSALIFIGFIDILLSSFFSTNITAFLPDKLSYLTPLLFGLCGLYLIRIEFSGNKLLDKINTNFNSSNFNALLTLLVIFALIKYIPPLLNWFVFDANFAGNTKEDCTRGGACWVFIKVWLNRFVYGLYPDTEQWRINTAFLILFLLVGASFFFLKNIKNILLFFYYSYIQ